MRTLSATLLAAQKKPDSSPYVEAKAYPDLLQGIKRLEWTRLYTGAEADTHHGIAFDGEGSMHRIRADGANIYRQKVISPGSASDYSAWDLLANDCAGPCAIAAYGAKVYIFYRTTGNVIWKYYSHDYGATWSNAQLSTWADVLFMSASWWGTGNNVVCFCLRVPPGAHGITDYCLNAIMLDSSTQAATEHATCEPSNHDLLEVFGIGSTYNATDNECDVIFAAKQDEATQPFYALYTTTLNDLFYWSGWKHFHMQFPDDDLWMTYPEAHRPASPATYENTEIIAVEHFTAAGAHDRPLAGHLVKSMAFSQQAFTELQPFASIDTPHGLRLQSTAGYWWLECPSGIWRAPRTAPLETDLTPDILALHQITRSEATQAPALSIILDNSKGTYATPPAKGSEVVLKLGYRTSAGSESSDAGHYWIDGWEHGSYQGNSTLTLYCRDLWQLADDWIARYVIRWNYNAVDPLTIWHCLERILARTGIRLWNNPDADRSAPLDTFYPKFYIRASAHGDTELHSLLDLCTDDIVPREGYCFTKDLRATEASCYDYTSVIATGEYSEQALITHVQVSGETNDTPTLTVMASAFDWDNLLLGIDNLSMHYDPGLEAADIAQKRADALLRKSSLRAKQGNLITPTNVGLELFDVVTVTDSRVGIASQLYRVLAIETDYEPSRATYMQRLWLGAP